MRFLLAILLLLLALPAHAQNLQEALVVSSCGSQTLSAGPLTNLTMNPAGQLCIGGSVAPSAPTNSVAPVASGTLTVGSLLSSTTGTWSNSPTGYAYQWQRGGVNIGGATSSTYTTVPADGGTAVGSQVTASNAGGSNSALSNTLAIAAPPNMSTPIFSTYNIPSASATNFSTFGAGLQGGSSLGKQVAWPTAGTISNLQIISLTTISTNYYTLAINKAGSPTALTCSVGTGGGTNLGTTTACADATDTVTVAAGDLIGIQSTVPGGTATAIAAQGLKISALFTSTSGQNSPIIFLSAAPSATAINYAGPGSAWQTTDALASFVMPVGGTINNLNVTLSAAAGATKDWVFTVFKNGVATSIVAGDATHCGGVSSLQCSDTTNSVAVAALDTISIQACPSAVSPLAANCPTGVGAPTVAVAVIAVNFTPTVANQAVIPAIPASVPGVATTNTFTQFSAGGYSATATENTVQQVAPVLGTTMTLGNLTVAQCPGPDTSGSGVTRAVTLRVASASPGSGPAVTVPASTTACPALSTIQDVTHTATATSAQALSYLTTLNTVTNAAALTEFKTSMTATLP